MDPFQKLDQDVVFQLLSEAPNAETILSCITASPFIFRVFQEFKERLLRRLVAQEDLEGVLGIAQANLESSRLQQRGIPKKQALKWMSEHDALLKNVSLPLDQISMNAFVQMARIHQDIKYFAGQFIYKRIPWLDTTDPVTSLNERYVEISRVEMMRLYRAIHRYAIHGNLFAYEDTRTIAKANRLCPQDQASWFLCRFTAWEVEEVACINDFMADIINKKWNEVRPHDFHYRTSPNPHMSHWELVHGPFNCPRRWLKAHFAALALPAFREFASESGPSLQAQVRAILDAAPSPAQLACVPNNCTHFLDSLADALRQFPYPLNAARAEDQMLNFWGAQRDGLRVRFQRDTLDLPNSAWVWTNGFRPCDVYINPLWRCTASNLEIVSGLRRCGYVFWDVQRLDAMLKMFNDVGDEESSVLLQMDLDPEVKMRVEERISRYMYRITGAVPF